MAEQKLNTLDRFRKQSERLVLEEHSHCEVPAGCGGVVLRWRDPFACLPLLVHLYSPGNSELYLDGERVVHTGNDVAPGEHLFAFVLEDADLSGGLFMFAAFHDQKRGKHLPPGVSEAPLWLVSAADGCWLATIEQPIDRAVTWIEPAYGDGDWQPLTRSVPSPYPEYREPNAYRANWCNRYSAAFLALPPQDGRGRVWVRRRFTVPGPTRSE